jgi:hypothetical protein
MAATSPTGGAPLGKLTLNLYEGKNLPALDVTGTSVRVAKCSLYALLALCVDGCVGMGARKCVYECVGMCVRVCMCMCMCVHLIHIYIYIYIYVCVCVCAALADTGKVFAALSLCLSLFSFCTR